MRPSKPASHRCLLRLPGLVALHGLLIIPSRAWPQRVDSLAAVVRVADAVCGKQVVVLAELPSHGEARTFQAKAAIVKRLVERCGFDGLLFEAPIYDFVGFQGAAAKDSAVPSQLDKAIGRFWWTHELADWRRWLFQRATSGQLVLGGLDDQVSVTSDYARATLPGLVAASSPPESAAECEQTVARNLFWHYDAERPFDESEQVRLQRCARDAVDSLAARAPHAHGTPQAVMLENFAGYADRQRNAAGALDRDAAMYSNVLWYTGRMPAGSKVIIWTATVHAARQQGDLPQRPLGARLAERWGSRLAVVGFTALGGRSSMAGRPSKPLPDAPPGSLETRALDGNAAWAVLNASALRAMGRAPSRLLGRFTVADWSASFDEVVVIREEVAPVFDPWQ